MNTAKQIVLAQQRYETENKDSLKKERADDAAENLKPEINNLLHTYLPSHITVGQAESLAIAICQMILVPEQFLTDDGKCFSN